MTPTSGRQALRNMDLFAERLQELPRPCRMLVSYAELYTTESFQYRDEVVATNGENNTYHAGAYLGDGLHEGAITSAFRVAQLVGLSQGSIDITNRNLVAQFVQN